MSVSAAMWSQSIDRKSTRLNSSHLVIPYAVFCLKKQDLRDAPALADEALPRGEPDVDVCDCARECRLDEAQSGLARPLDRDPLPDGQRVLVGVGLVEENLGRGLGADPAARDELGGRDEAGARVGRVDAGGRIARFFYVGGRRVHRLGDGAPRRRDRRLVALDAVGEAVLERPEAPSAPALSGPVRAVPVVPASLPPPPGPPPNWTPFFTRHD